MEVIYEEEPIYPDVPVWRTAEPGRPLIFTAAGLNLK